MREAYTRFLIMSVMIALSFTVSDFPIACVFMLFVALYCLITGIMRMKKAKANT